MWNVLTFKEHATMRMFLYIVSILVNGAAIVVRPIANEWGDALQYVGGALAAITGVVALSNVEKESSTTRNIRKIDEVSTPIKRCPFHFPNGEQCILGEGHDETYGHIENPHG